MLATEERGEDRTEENFRHYNGRVGLVDNISLDIIGVGDVTLRTSLGTKWTLKNVKFILELKRMLISIGKLDDEVRKIEFDNHQRKVTKGSMVIIRGQKRESLYMVEDYSDEIHFVVEY
ncbi:hypothetical protein L1887_29709 [Cichorium endivia]|nr:hypothetical protein L1887_29709 [Cichorium endivia]